MKSTQEQAVASWVQYLNTLRLENLIKNINSQDINLDNALKNLDNTLSEINKLISSNRGGESGIHGFIAEISEVGIGNAKANIIGNEDVYKWVNNNGMVDLVRNGTDIQQKFYNRDLSLSAIAEHLKKYPNFLKQGGKYQIPKDQYDKIKYLLSRCENGTEDIISVRSKAFQALKKDIDDYSMKELVSLIQENPSILKRPILLSEKSLVVGYDDDEITTMMPAQLRTVVDNACTDACPNYSVCGKCREQASMN